MNYTPAIMRHPHCPRPSSLFLVNTLKITPDGHKLRENLKISMAETFRNSEPGACTIGFQAGSYRPHTSSDHIPLRTTSLDLLDSGIPLRYVSYIHSLLGLKYYV
jgi:hypothetical protein